MKAQRRPDSRTAMVDAIAAFREEVRRIALALVRRELDSLGAMPLPLPHASTPTPSAASRSRTSTAPATSDAASSAATVVAEMPDESLGGEADATAHMAPVAKPWRQEGAHEAAAAPATVEPRTEPATSAVSGRKRVRWTRDAIITELASWVVKGSAVEASFVKRHGPPGLVAAALREFGRFDAALNVASLQVARLYPDGPPAR